MMLRGELKAGEAAVRWLPVFVFILSLPWAQAMLPPTRQPVLPDFDNRKPATVSSAEPQRNARFNSLRGHVGHDAVEFDNVTGSPRWVRAPAGFLTGTDGNVGNGGGVSPQALAAVPTDDPNHVVKAFLNEHTSLFGHGTEALNSARVIREFVAGHNGMRTVVWEQQLDGIPVFEGVLVAHTTKRNELVSIASGFVREPMAAANKGMPRRLTAGSTPVISARQAVALAAREAGETFSAEAVVATGQKLGATARERLDAPGLTDVSAQLTWLPLDASAMRLCWDVLLTSRARGEMFRLLVDAEDGKVFIRRCLTEYDSVASYRVYTSDSPTPFSPGYSTPSSGQPAVVPRSLVTLAAVSTNASPAGWINDGDSETLGNNVDAHTDLSGDNVADLPRPAGTSFRVFDYPLDLTQEPATCRDASVVQLFYTCNWMHDKLYDLGFTEAAGNFQNNNFGRGGLGWDALQADAQDGDGKDNANMSTPTDGCPPRMQMFLFTGPTPDRDAGLDAEVVLHEYTHGMSNRRVGGGVGISAPQSRGLGEGWSDFYALALLSEAGDDVNGVYATAAYISYLLSDLTENYYYGIRRYPYCTDMAKNPLTFKDIDPAQADYCSSGAPYTSRIDNCSTSKAGEFHNVGEVWCMTLWEARARLIEKHGWAAGNQLILQLVTDGMNLSPANPTFVEARDAILQADQVNTGGANRVELWAAFAKRGLGVNAAAPSSSTTSGVVESYDIPDDLYITPIAGLDFSGPSGGPFTSNPAAFVLSNAGSNALAWSLSSTCAWLTVSVPGGTLAAGGPATNIPISVNSAANSLTGIHSATIWFTNITSGAAQSRQITLCAVGTYCADDFDSAIDLAQWSAFGGRVGSTVLANSYGGCVSSPNSLWLGDVGIRHATTMPINTESGGSISFSIRLANGSGSNWNSAGFLPDEGVILEASTNAGTSWILLGSCDTAAYYSWTPVSLPIPSAVQVPTALFRWRQKIHSGYGSNHWALDNVVIDATPPSNVPPVIRSQPSNLSVAVGDAASFGVSAWGTLPMSYQWTFNGIPISGATNKVLALPCVQTNDAGAYDVTVSNPAGSTNSANATLSVALVRALDHFTWSAIAATQHVNESFTATLEARDHADQRVTSFSGPVDLSATAISSTQVSPGRNIVGRLTPDGTGSGTYTLGFSFTPTNPITITHVLHCAGTKVSIWSSNGTLLAAQSVFGSEYPGDWTSTPLSEPLRLTAGSQYVVSFYTGGGSFCYRASMPTNFADGIVGQSLCSPGNAFPASVMAGFYMADLGYTASELAPVPITPSITGNFTNGVWSGNLTLQQPATRVVVSANDGDGHFGSGNPFDVLVPDDLSINAASAPDPVSVGDSLTFTVTVINSGPSSATDVRVASPVPAMTSFVSAAASQGTCALSNGIVLCDLGTLPGDSSATIRLVVMPTTASMTISNSATVTRAETDPCLPNNTASATATVSPPWVWIDDATVVEGNVGTTNLQFEVKLTAPSLQPVSVNFATSNGTAVADADYLATNGMLTFAPGVTSRVIPVAVIGDIARENPETLYVNLSGSVNSTVGRGQATGTILPDDGLSGQIQTLEWGAIATPQLAGVPFIATLTAYDYSGALATSFNGTAALTGQSGVWMTTVESNATSTMNYPMDAHSRKQRTQVIYPASELGGAGPITALALEVASHPVDPWLNNWTVRLRHTSLTNYSNRLWVTTNWTVVCQTNLNLTGTGWVAIPFSAPFEYNGSNSLMVDFSFNNSTNTGFGVSCRGSSRSSTRVLYFQVADTSYGDPLTWSNSIPSALSSVYVPNLRLTRGTASVVSVEPSTIGPFTNGVWSGRVIVTQAATNVALIADDLNGHVGQSSSFNLYNADAFSIGSVNAAGRYITLTWNAAPGHFYTLQYRTNLAFGEWMNVDSVTATENKATLTDDLGPDPAAWDGQRFYRIRIEE